MDELSIGSDDATEDKAQQLTTAIDAVAAVITVAIDPISSVIGLTTAGAKSYIERFLLARQRRLDELMREGLREIRDRVDSAVKLEDFVPLYIRAREISGKTEQEEKLRYIRNLLLNAVVKPTSEEASKERYLRLIDDLTLEELDHLVAFTTKALETRGRSIDEYILNHEGAGLAFESYARDRLGLPIDGSVPRELVALRQDLDIVFRHLESVGLLDGVRQGYTHGTARSFSTNRLTPRFLAFALEPRKG